jgi:hypothetical protein
VVRGLKCFSRTFACLTALPTRNVEQCGNEYRAEQCHPEREMTARGLSAQVKISARRLAGAAAGGD